MRLLNTAAVAATLFSAALTVPWSMEGPTCISRSAKNTPSIASSQVAPARSEEVTVLPPAAPLPLQAVPIQPKASSAPFNVAPIPQEASSQSEEVSVRPNVEFVQLNAAPIQPNSAVPPIQTKESSVWSVEGPTCISRSKGGSPTPGPSREAPVQNDEAPQPENASVEHGETPQPKNTPVQNDGAPHLKHAPVQNDGAPQPENASVPQKESSVWSMEGPTCISRTPNNTATSLSPTTPFPTKEPSHEEAPVPHNEAPQLKHAPIQNDETPRPKNAAVPIKASSVWFMEGPTCISRTRKDKPTPPPSTATSKGVSLKSDFKFSIKIHIKFEIVFVDGRAWAHFLDIDMSDSDSFSYHVVFTDETRTEYHVESCLPEERNTVIVKTKSSYEYMGCTAEECEQKMVGANGKTTVEQCSGAKCRVNVACRDGAQCTFEQCDSGCHQVRVYSKTTPEFSIRTLPEHPAPPRIDFKVCKLPAAPLPARQVFRFSNETWIENIAVRGNGDLLLTQMQPNASLYALSNSMALISSVRLIHTFPSLTGLSGIAEISEDVFVVIGFNFSSTGPVNGSAESWIIDFRAEMGGPSVKRIAKHPEMVLPNGVAKLPSQNNTVLVSDSVRGLVWRLSVDSPSPKAEIAVQSGNMTAEPDSPFRVGVNGIKVEKSYLYWSNSFQGGIYRLRIDEQGKPAQNASDELVHHEPGEKTFIDDFTYDDRGLWGATKLNSTVFYAPRNRTLGTTIAGKGNSVVSGATACAFGRMEGDAKTLYVVTGLNGTAAEGGKVVAIDTTTV